MRGARLAFVALLTAATATSHSLELPDDGRFTFVRLRWAGGNLSSRGWSAAWNDDYPRAGRESHHLRVAH